MQLSYRLKTVAEMVRTKGVVADIGCDHAYVSIYLIQHKLALKVIAMDINKGPLERAKENIKQSGLQDIIETRLSNGAQKLEKKEADTLLIGGMGGALIIKILSQRKEVVDTCKELVLQPQSEIHLVRKYIRQNGFRIEEENMLIDEGKYYVVMRALPSEIVKEEKEVYDRYGKFLLEKKSIVLRTYLKNGYEKKMKLLKELQQSSSEKAKQRADELRTDLEYIKEGLTYYEV